MSKLNLPPLEWGDAAYGMTLDHTHYELRPGVKWYWQFPKVGVLNKVLLQFKPAPTGEVRFRIVINGVAFLVNDVITQGRQEYQIGSETKQFRDNGLLLQNKFSVELQVENNTGDLYHVHVRWLIYPVWTYAPTSPEPKRYAVHDEVEPQSRKHRKMSKRGKAALRAFAIFLVSSMSVAFGLHLLGSGNDSGISFTLVGFYGIAWIIHTIAGEPR